MSAANNELITVVPELTRLRGRIDEVDRGILELFAQRQHISCAIAQVKGQLGIPVFDPIREKEVIAKWQEIGATLGLTDDAVELVWTALMSASKKAQEENI